MPAAAVLSDVYRSLQTELGEEVDGSTFENGPGPLARIDVMVHRTGPLLVFATIGMSIEPMPTGDNRAELRLHRRGPLNPDDHGRIAVQLANTAGYPWHYGRPLNWGEIVPLGGQMPTFGGCSALFLAGPWMQGQPGYLDTGAGPVQVINAVPITEAERAHARTMHPMRFFEGLLGARDVTIGG
nr:suppressor of fused domain protein [Kibdelosporangium sp. MJ126-NF4]CEL20248.1 hypothetical protein [Kibdelosporangium sp. MJ126-NF4]CTQ97474.1 hypothetical protein [Kibdelosporangium sp. MJ126-NF4]